MGANQSRPPPPTPPPTPPSPAAKPSVSSDQLRAFLLAGRSRESRWHIPSFGECEVDCGDVSLLAVQVDPEVAAAVLDDGEVADESEYM